MAAVPKNKRSKAKRNTKRNSFKLNVLSIVECPRCRAKKIAHRVCRACGYYDNKEIIKLEKKSKEKAAEKTKETAGAKPKVSKNKKAANTAGAGKNPNTKKTADNEITVKTEPEISEKAAGS